MTRTERANRPHVRLWGAIIGSWLLLLPLTSQAQEDERDPLGLVPHAETERTYSLGSDRIGVFRCEGADNRSAAFYADALTRLVQPWFEHHSRGAYSPDFQPRPKVVPDASSLCQGGFDAEWARDWFDEDGLDGAVIVGPNLYQSAAQDYLCAGSGDDLEPCPDLDNGILTRYMVLNSADILGPETGRDYDDYYHASIVAHELGHTLNWPHTYTGNVTRGSDTFGRVPMVYDTLGDVMSAGGDTPGDGEDLAHAPIAGTSVFNLYRSGWIPSDQVAVVDGEGGTFDLAPNHASQGRWRMIVIPDETDPDTFFVLGARTGGAHDYIADAWEGVEVFRVVPYPRQLDGRDIPEAFRGQFPVPLGGQPTSCIEGNYDPSGESLCSDWSVDDRLPHVLQPGQGAHVGAYTVSVADRQGTSFTVDIQRGHHRLPSGSSFEDTTESVFGGDIEWLANAGITRGCNPPTNNQFCPDQPVTRGQMASFLQRALDLSRTNADFTDVTSGNPHHQDIGALANAGITRGCNPPTNNRFCPDQPVTRGQMAAFLYRALES